MFLRYDWKLWAPPTWDEFFVLTIFLIVGICLVICAAEISPDIFVFIVLSLIIMIGEYCFFILTFGRGPFEMIYSYRYHHYNRGKKKEKV